MRMEQPAFTAETPKVERAFGELALHSVVAVYAPVGVPEDPLLLLVTAGRVVATPERSGEARTGHDHILIAPFDASGTPVPNEFRAFFPDTSRFQYSFRFFELQPTPGQEQT